MTNLIRETAARARSSAPGRVRVGVDFSDQSLNALRWALHEAALRGVECEVLHAAAPMAHAGRGIHLQLADLYEHLARVVADSQGAAELGAAITTDVEFGAASDVLRRDAPRDGVLVVGARGRGALASAVLGSVSEQCMHRVASPMVVVPPTAEAVSRRGRIVVGVDGSDVSRRALSWAAAEATLRGDALTVVHVWHPMVVVPNPWVPNAIPPDIGRQAAEDTLVHATSQVAGDLTPMLIEGYAHPALVAESATADLLVVGGDGRGQWGGGLVGSVTQRCARHSHCPVAIVR